MSDLEARIAEVLAYQHCRMTNSKADHPIFGYHAFSEDQREYLRSVMMPAAEAVTQLLAPVIAEAKTAALRETADELEANPVKGDTIFTRLVLPSCNTFAVWQLRARADSLGQP